MSSQAQFTAVGQTKISFKDIINYVDNISDRLIFGDFFNLLIYEVLIKCFLSYHNMNLNSRF
jgi:hypothetical protein